MSNRSGTGLGADIATELENDIQSGRMLPGQPLDERELALRFGVSRTPVRAAVQQLAARGMLKVVPRQGLQVARVSVSELREMFEVLAELEGACAKLSARRMNDECKARLQEACGRCEKAAAAGDVAAYTDANAAFHDALYDACRNRFLTHQILDIRRRTSVYRLSVFQLPGRMRDSAQDHVRLVEAIVRGDMLEAQNVMVQHITVGGAGFAEFVSLLPPGLLASDDQATAPLRPAVARKGARQAA